MDVYDASTGIDVLVSKSTFTYDLGGEFRVATNPSNDSVTQHDPAYDSNFSYRGNISKAFRYDVGDPTNQNNTAAQTESGYNSSGSLVFERRLHKASPAVWHQTTIGYVDSFSVVGNNGNTFAYPTTVTDPDGFQSFVKYNFDFGGVTEKQTPSPNAGQTAPKQLITYDSLGRVSQLTNNINGAYVRHVYGATYVQSYSTVNTAADEAYSISFFDGAGREYYSASNHPGSTGGYKAVSTKYDVMGRVWKVSNPTEVNGSSLPTGDDAGWFYTTQTYDWKSRPLATTNTDGSTRTASYGGCGCAGGEVVTLTDEVNRRQKFSTDFLGRQWKAEVLNTDSTVYSTSVSVFNVRDQVTNVKQYDGAAPGDASSTNAAASCPNPSATCQETKMTYDGHGRLQTKHLPEQNLGAATVYAYNLDDTLYSSTDARTAATTYGYNGRHLVTSVVTTLPGLSTIAVTHGYDGASNRTSMSHLVGGVAKDSASSSYDQLSRLTSETRHINALEGYSPNYGNFTMGYGYTLSNALQSVTDPFNSTTTLSYDVAGRTASVTGSFSGTNYTYANNVVYRAWGGVKSASVGGVAETVSYNSRLQPREFRSYQMRYDYSYFDDGKLKGIKDLDDQIGDPHEVQFHYMSRAYSYDQSGRVSGVGQLPNHNVIPPFSGNYGYDAFDNLTSRGGQYALGSYQSDSAGYTNNRRNGWNYNAEGRITSSTDNSDSGGSSTRTWTYDAAGDLVTTSEIRNGQTKTMSLAYDGDGKLLYESVNGTTSDYLIRSTVLGAVLTKLTATGGKDITYVPANGLVAPMQNENPGFTPFMSWVQRDALGVQERQSNTADNVKAYDPFGGLIPNTQPPLGGGPPPYVPFYGATYGGLSWNSFANANNLAAGCNVGGFPMDCSRAMIGAMGLDFAMNLGFHLDNVTAEASYTVSRTFTTKQWINDPVQERPTLKRRRHSSDPGPEWDERGLGHWLIRTWASIFTLNHEVLEPQKPSRQTYSPKDLKGTVTALASGKCATFLERLYRTVAGMNPQRAPQSKDFNILDVFNSVTSRPGAVVITPDLRSPSGRPIGGTISGTLGDSVDPATITINAITYYGTLPKAGRDFAEYSYAIRAIHESFHFAAKGGGYGDYELARAVSAITGAPVPEGDVFVKSDFWNDELERRCPEIRR